jgi:hypothetical protein
MRGLIAIKGGFSYFFSRPRCESGCCPQSRQTPNNPRRLPLFPQVRRQAWSKNEGESMAGEDAGTDKFVHGPGT